MADSLVFRSGGMVTLGAKSGAAGIEAVGNLFDEVPDVDGVDPNKVLSNSLRSLGEKGLVEWTIYNRHQI